MELFFNAASAISPLGSFEDESILLTQPVTEGGFLSCKEPDYRNTIDKKLLRRMSRFIRMAVANSVHCLARAGIEQPDAIITGTGLGCVADTIDFLSQMNEQAETMLNPTAFMQSTHNTASGQIALLLGCRNFNITFSQKNISFESALLHSQMMLSGEDYGNILIGGIDEITPESHALISRTSCFRSNEGSPLLSGEGAAFFVIGKQRSSNSVARLIRLAMFNGNEKERGFNESFNGFLDQNDCKAGSIDMLITGAHRTGEVCRLFRERFDENSIIHFKDFCGEYDTSTAFGLWLAIGLIKGNSLAYRGKRPVNVMIHNQGSGPYHSLILVSAC